MALSAATAAFRTKIVKSEFEVVMAHHAVFGVVTQRAVQRQFEVTLIAIAQRDDASPRGEN